MSQLFIDSQLVELPDNIPGKDCAGGFVCSLHKAGSTMLFSAVRRLVLRAGTKYADAHKIFSVAGLLLDNVELTKPNRSALETWFSQPGVLFGGWRQYPTNLDLPLMSLTKTYLLVRDPRDIATSKY